MGADLPAGGKPSYNHADQKPIKKRSETDRPKPTPPMNPAPRASPQPRQGLHDIPNGVISVTRENDVRQQWARPGHPVDSGPLCRPDRGSGGHGRHEPHILPPAFSRDDIVEPAARAISLLVESRWDSHGALFVIRFPC